MSVFYQQGDDGNFQQVDGPVQPVNKTLSDRVMEVPEILEGAKNDLFCLCNRFQ